MTDTRVKYNRKWLLKFLSIETRFAVKKNVPWIANKNNSPIKQGAFKWMRDFCYHTQWRIENKHQKNMMNWWHLYYLLLLYVNCFFLLQQSEKTNKNNTIKDKDICLYKKWWNFASVNKKPYSELLWCVYFRIFYFVSKYSFYWCNKNGIWINFPLS